MSSLHLEIDAKKCMGCCACEIACKMEYELPQGIRYIVMKENEISTDGMDRLHFSFLVCKQCEDAPCLTACPANAISKDADGVVLVRKDQCIGCKNCLFACPYQVPQFGSNQKMQKCQLCLERREKGLLPACMVACPANAIKMA